MPAWLFQGWGEDAVAATKAAAMYVAGDQSSAVDVTSTDALAEQASVAPPA